MKYTFKKFLELDKETQRQIGTLTEEMSVSMKKKKMIELETLLKSFDWFYFYSDDSRSYRKGDEEQSKIRRLVDFIGKDGMKLYKSYGKKRGVM
jgi:hypothetical protein